MTRSREKRHSLVQLIKLAEMSTRHRLEKELKPFRLSSGQLLILVRVEREGEISPADLARGLYQTPQSIGKLYPPLEARGLLQRRADPENPRRLFLSLTDEAKALLTKMRRHLVQVDSEIAETLGTEDARRLEEALLKLI